MALWYPVLGATSFAPFYVLTNPAFRGVNPWQATFDSRKTPFKFTCAYTCFEVRDVTYRPPGSEITLLNHVSLSLREKSFGLIFGRSGSGKTTLLQLLAGLNKPTSGCVCLQEYENNGDFQSNPLPLNPQKVGIVFQFPERYFVAETVLEEIIFGWPKRKTSFAKREQLALNVQRAINWGLITLYIIFLKALKPTFQVGLNEIPLEKDPNSLSGGFKRRLALAIQLLEVPDLLILDEPLAGLDWRARSDVVRLLSHLKQKLTILVVSHDLREFKPIVDRSWRMQMGGFLHEEFIKS